MEKNSLKKQYKDNSLEELFRPLPMPETSRVASKPTPQPKPQPKMVQSPVEKRRNTENSALVEAFNKKYGVLNLKGKDYDEQMALFKERWEAEQAGQKMPVRPGSALDRMAREEGYGKTTWRKTRSDEYGDKPDNDQSPAAKARRMEALNRSLQKLKID